MRYLKPLLVLSILVLALSAPGAEREKPAKTPEQLYGRLGGPWRSDDDKSPLAGVWLHRNEKSDPPSPKALPWSVILDFRGGSPEGYSGEPARVKVDGDGLKITLPPARVDEKRRTHTLRLQRDGDRLEVRVSGGRFAGTYHLKRVASKQ